MHMCCKSCKKQTGNTFPRKLVLTSENKIKGKSKCAICLTEKSFILEIEDKEFVHLKVLMQNFVHQIIMM